jgi:hypothetical protein
MTAKARIIKRPNRRTCQKHHCARPLAYGRSPTLHTLRPGGPTMETAATTTTVAERKDLAVSNDPLPNGDRK